MSKRIMPVKPEYLRASFTGRAVKVDREAEVLRGYVVAQEGPFKTEGRGRFDDVSLQEIVSLGNQSRNGVGVKSRFTHPGLSSDGLGKFLGRAKNFSLGTATDARGKSVKAVRADLHFDPSAHSTPNGDLAKYVMDLAESDPDALSSSIVLKPRQLIEDGKGGYVELDQYEEPPPGVTPLWRIAELHASDIVDTGDAVDGLLSADQLTEALSVGLTPELAKVLKWDNAVRLASQVLDGVFKDQPKEVVEARVQGFVARYLEGRYGEAEHEGVSVSIPAGLLNKYWIGFGERSGGGFGLEVTEDRDPLFRVDSDTLQGAIRLAVEKAATLPVPTPELDMRMKRLDALDRAAKKAERAAKKK